MRHTQFYALIPLRHFAANLMRKSKMDSITRAYLQLLGQANRCETRAARYMAQACDARNAGQFSTADAFRRCASNLSHRGHHFRNRAAELVKQ